MVVIYKVIHYKGEHDCTWDGCSQQATHEIAELETDTDRVSRAYTCDTHTDDFNNYARKVSKELKR